MFWTAAAGLDCAMLLLDAAPGRFDLPSRPRAQLDAANGYGAREFSICEYLRRAFAGADQSGLGQQLRGDLHPLRKPVEIVQPYQLMLDSKDISESALGETSRERHLAALEPWLPPAGPVMSRTRLDSLMTFTGSFSSS